MDPDIRRRRHAQLWESGTSSARKIGITGLIFAILVLLRVVEPYHLVERIGQEDLELLENKRQELLVQQKQLGSVETALQEIEDELDKSPWNDEIENLKKYFVELRANGYESDEIPQDMAKKTITNIGKLVSEKVIVKLRDVTAGPGTSERLAKYPDTIQEALTKWVDKNENNTKWYFTPESKDETISVMSEELAALKAEALAAVVESRKNLEVDRKELVDAEAAIDKSKEDAEGDIKDELNEILPGWAQDSVGVRSMIIFFPWILVAFAVTMVSKAFIAAGHFHGMADEEQWTAVERSDPLLSTPWTLTWRGLPGTLLTIVNYSAVIGAYCFCLYRVEYPPAVYSSGSTEDTTIEASLQAIANAVSSVLPVGFVYASLIATLVVVAATPVLRRARESGGTR